MMSSQVTSLPHLAHSRLYLIRPPSASCRRWNLRLLLSTAEKSLTGMLMSPNEIAPFQIGLTLRILRGGHPCPAIVETIANPFPAIVETIARTPQVDCIK